MPPLAANLTLLFAELPFLDRFDAARRAGFDGVEILFPYDHDAHEIRRALADCGLPLVLFNTPPGDWAGGERGFAAVPGAEARFAAGLAQALDTARILKPRHIHVMAGLATGPDAEAQFVASLRRCVRAAPDQSFLIEPINPFDMPGYFLSDFDLAARILERVGADNLALQFDAYHAQRITGDLPGCWRRHGPAARHIQIAGHPGRHEPLPSSIPYEAFMAGLVRDGYGGFVSAEYHPRAGTAAGLGWMARLSGRPG